MRYLFCLVLLAVPTSVMAQDNLFRASLVAAATAHAMDIGSTQRCIGEGRCRELNPWLARYDNPVTFSAAKMLVASLSLWGTAKLHESHPKLATLVNVAMAGGFTAIAVRNARVAHRSERP